MDSSDTNRNPSDVSSNKNIQDEKANLSPNSPTEEAPAANANPSEALALMPQPLDDREYGCKYCSKKFSNKQALGGHQNAHKVERAMEKTTRDPLPDTHFPYSFAGGSAAAGIGGGGDPSSYTGLMMMMGNPNPNTHHHHHFLGSSCTRSHDFVNRPNTINWPYSSSSSHQQHHQQVQQQHHHHLHHHHQQQQMNQRQAALQIRHNNSSSPAYVPPRPLPGYSNVDPGWTATRAAAMGPLHRVNNPYNNNNSYNYPGQPPYMQNQQNQAAAQVMYNNNNLRRHPMTIGGGGGGAMMRPGSHQGFGGGPGIRPGNMVNPGGENRNMMVGNMVNPGGENRNMMVVNQPANEEVDDSEMDLSLKL